MPPTARVAEAPRHASATRTTGAPRWVVTLLGVVSATVRLGVEEAVRAQGGQVHGWRELGPTAQELTCSVEQASEPDLRLALHELGNTAPGTAVDVVLQTEANVRAGKKLAVFDLDSTLIAEETIDELAAEAGSSERVQALTRKAMAGDLAFRDALAQRVATLKGLKMEALEKVRQRATYTPGAKEVISVLSSLGCKTAVVSGGFHFLADHVRDTLGLDYSYANCLESENGVLTGRTIGPIVDAQFKSDTLTNLSKQLSIPNQNTMAIGDGSNDVIMLQNAGLGIAFNAKPRVQNVAKARINQPSLRHVLYLLGMDDQQIRNALP